ncbi:MAG TPA: hypothetical protein VF069_23700 [Streptosporangiaceae bacterium]
MRQALATRHMGKIERAFRTHACGRPIPQSVAASWFFLTQAQLSRIESGPPIQNIDRLVQWAHILRIPVDLLWFPAAALRESAPTAGAGPERSAVSALSAVGPDTSGASGRLSRAGAHPELAAPPPSAAGTGTQAAAVSQPSGCRCGAGAAGQSASPGHGGAAAEPAPAGPAAPARPPSQAPPAPPPTAPPQPPTPAAPPAPAPAVPPAVPTPAVPTPNVPTPNVPTPDLTPSAPVPPAPVPPAPAPVATPAPPPAPDPPAPAGPPEPQHHLSRADFSRADLSGHDPVPDEDEWRRLAELSRTTFFERGFGAGPLPAIGLDELQHIAIALTDARRYADDAVVGHLTRRLDACAASDRRHGPKRSIPALMGLIAAVGQLTTGARPEVGRDLLRVGSRAAELAGFFYRDLLMQELAGYWRDRAVEWAQAAHDFSMQGYMLLKKAQAAWDDRDAVRMLTFAQAAQEGPWRLPPHILAEAAQQEARAHALLGRDFDTVERRLDRARALFARHDPAALDPAAGLSAHYSEALLNLQVAMCYGEAGRAGRALELYGRWLTEGAFSRRDYGHFLSLKALAYAAAGEPGEASAAGLRALALARETNSARTHQEVLRLVRRLGRWRDRGDVAALRAAVLA